MVDARRAVILMTTNCGRGAAVEHAARDPHGADVAAVKATAARIRTEVLADICGGRFENLGRLGAVVPFMPLDESGTPRDANRRTPPPMPPPPARSPRRRAPRAGRRAVVRRQLRDVDRRLQPLGATLRGCSEALVGHVAAQWDDDLGGRSTRDFVETDVVEAIAEVFETRVRGATSGEPPPPLALELDVGDASHHRCGAAAAASPAVVCTVLE
jgi:ATP-dependent Clp protease ATP-binding subunit ClpA